MSTTHRTANGGATGPATGPKTAPQEAPDDTPRAGRRGLAARWNGKAVARSALYLILASFLVGIVLDVAGVDPVSFWRGLADAVRGSFNAIVGLGWGAVTTALTYVAIGAVIVLPIWLVLTLIRLAKR